MLDKYQELIETCTICHDQCVFACPIFTVERKTTTYPSRKAQIARCLLHQQIDWNEESADLFYHCISCKLCERWCVYLKDRKDPSPVFKEARIEAIDKNVILSYVLEAGEKYKKYGNLHGDLDSTIQQMNTENKNGEESNVLYLVDADTLALSLDSAVAFVNILNHLNIKPNLSMYIDTGIDAISIGWVELGKETALKLTEYINGMNVEKVVVSSPKAYYALVHMYPEINLHIEKNVLLESQYLSQILKEKGINVTKMNISATYQDGIYMARYLKEHEEPRYLIKPMVSRFIEMRTNRMEAKPVAPEDYPLGLSEEILQGIAKVRLNDIEETRTDYVITSDPNSYHALRKYLGKSKVMSISELVAANILNMQF